MLNPHLFTHLFYEGVIVSTRKLVYDSGSNEEAIKSLMQAQHKAVMKDLRKGTFDDKIDQYLGGTPGLEPRAGGGDAKPLPRGERAPTEADALVAEAAMDSSGGSPIEIVNEDLSTPIELPLKQQAVPTVARTESGDQTVPVDTHHLDAPTLQTGDMAAAINQANQGAPPAQARTKTAPKVSKSQVVDPRAPTYHSPGGDSRDSAPVIEIAIDEDEISARLRGPRDTAVQDDAPHAQQQRPASHGAATLPKSPSRPPPPMVSARPATQDRKREESQPVEIHSPAPPSVEPPPGERSER